MSTSHHKENNTRATNDWNGITIYLHLLLVGWYFDLYVSSTCVFTYVNICYIIIDTKHSSAVLCLYYLSIIMCIYYIALNTVAKFTSLHLLLSNLLSFYK